MAKFLKDKSIKTGTSPGTLVYITDQNLDSVKIRVTNFNKETLEEIEVANVEECNHHVADPKTVTWIDIEGLADSKVIENIGKLFGIHRLWLEDVLNTDHRPKVEEINDLLFVIIKSVSNLNERILTEQISLFLGDGFVISFQEHQGDTFEDVRKRLRKSKWIIRDSGPDYLFYALIDVVVDNYFNYLESLGTNIEALESRLSNDQSQQIPLKIAQYRQDLLYLNKSCIPVREALSHICRSSRPDILSGNIIYYKDALEHTIQIVETIESYRQMLTTIMESYQAITNQKMNEIMKVLTIFASIFTPLTFLAGIYGMNFENMPELKWQNGYFYALGAMLIFLICTLLFIKKKRWI